MSFYLGNPLTGTMVELPHPGKGLQPTMERGANVRRTVGGGQSVALSPGVRRTYSLQWTDLSPTEYTVLEEFFTGGRGPGPWALVDPGRRNHLSLNQASATSADNDGTGWYVMAPETVTSEPDAYVRGPRSARWSLPAGYATGILRFPGPGSYPGVPVIPGQPWTFTAQVSATATSATVVPALSFLDRGGYEVAAYVGSPVVANVGAWAAVAIAVGLPPVGGVFVQPQLRVAVGTVSAGATGYGSTRLAGLGIVTTRGLSEPMLDPEAGGPRFVNSWLFTSAPAVLVDTPMLDMSASQRPWVLGTGVPLVSVTALPETYITLPGRNVQATLVEVGP